jgi:hypothetical protein
MIPRLHVPLEEREDVVRHLGKQEQHWKAGRSAHALASLWCTQNGIPNTVAQLLTSHAEFRSAELIDGFMEKKVDLGSDGHASQTDMLAILGLECGLAIAAVEGKAGESFGETVQIWIRENGSAESLARKEKRLLALCQTLGLSQEAAMPLRYQLLHRTASAIYEAKRYRTKLAVMLVHSFSDDENGFSDFIAFLTAVGFRAPTAGVLAGPVTLDGISLYAGWVNDKAPAEPAGAYLDRLRNYAETLSRWCDRVRVWCDERKAAL